MSVDLLVFSNLDQVMGNLAALASKVPMEAAGALTEVAEETLGEADPLVPKDFGVLRNSKFVDKPIMTGEDITVILGYGGEASAYAEAVHEHPSKHDPKSWRGVSIKWQTPGTGPKYLEKPVVALKSTFLEKVGTRLKQRLGLA